MRDFPIIEKAAFNLAVWSLAGDILSFYILQDIFNKIKISYFRPCRTRAEEIISRVNIISRNIR